MKIVLFLCVLYFLSSCKEQTPPTNNSQKIETIQPDEAPKPHQKLDDFVELVHVNRRLFIDIRYATENNFVGEKMYECGKCFLRRTVADRLNQVILELNDLGYGVKLYDCYRPQPIQQKLWDKVPNASYVTPPSKGSMHNRGQAVDLTLTDASGQEVDMGTDYDYFGEEAHHTYRKHPPLVQKHRDILKNTIEKHGFLSIRTEWWHYSLSGPEFEISDWEWGCE